MSFIQEIKRWMDYRREYKKVRAELVNNRIFILAKERSVMSEINHNGQGFLKFNRPKEAIEGRMKPNIPGMQEQNAAIREYWLQLNDALANKFFRGGL